MESIEQLALCFVKKEGGGGEKDNTKTSIYINREPRRPQSSEDYEDVLIAKAGYLTFPNLLLVV